MIIIAIQKTSSTDNKTPIKKADTIIPPKLIDATDSTPSIPWVARLTNRNITKVVKVKKTVPVVNNVKNDIFNTELKRIFFISYSILSSSLIVKSRKKDLDRQWKNY